MSLVWPENLLPNRVVEMSEPFPEASVAAGPNVAAGPAVAAVAAVAVAVATGVAAEEREKKIEVSS